MLDLDTLFAQPCNSWLCESHCMLNHSLFASVTLIHPHEDALTFGSHEKVAASYDTKKTLVLTSVSLRFKSANETSEFHGKTKTDSIYAIEGKTYK